MGKMILGNEEILQKFYDGVTEMASVVKSTFGPNGRIVAIQEANGSMHLTKDGATVAKHVTLSDPFENIGAQVLRDVSLKTMVSVGDGTTTSVVLAEGLVNAVRTILKIHPKVNVNHLLNRIDEVVREVCTFIQSKKMNVKSLEILKKIAIQSCNGDKELGSTIAEFFFNKGQGAEVIVQQLPYKSKFIQEFSGMRFDVGLSDRAYSNIANRVGCVLDNPYVFVSTKDYHNFDAIYPVIQWVADQNKESRQTRPLLMIVADMQPQLNDFLLLNKKERKFPFDFAVLKAKQSFGGAVNDFLEDCANYCGTNLFSGEGGELTHTADLSGYMGALSKSMTEGNMSILFGHPGNKDLLSSRIASIEQNITETKDKGVLEILKRRSANLQSAIGIFHLGAETVTEARELTDRADDCIHATRSAFKNGYVPGGGTIYLHAIKSLKKRYGIVDGSSSHVGLLACQAVVLALAKPFQTILENSGYEFKEFQQCAENITHHQIGKTVSTDTLELISTQTKGILDPVDVCTLALKNAASAVLTLLRTGYAIVHVEDVNDKILKLQEMQMQMQGF